MSDLLTPRVAVSVGELMDKITILEIKRDRIPKGDEGRANVSSELDELCAVMRSLPLNRSAIEPMRASLKKVNERLWEIEDALRDMESRRDFGDEFVASARLVYLENDRRGALKREINRLSGSRLIEEKRYAAY